ncbi:MAG: flagellar biosynthesis protein FlhA [Oscillospiraceae bacterium]|nr:flagellar biosynthesis protein FlhA [Oscillospiraceae bacterium]
MGRIARAANNLIAIFVVVIILMLVVPLPPGMLDFMFMLSLTVSFVILLMTMYIKETLDFSIFPSLMLITTLLRLSLNVSSTRSILENYGYAGELIKTFGNFVIGGNVAIGFVVFAIIVFVNFLVITKGAERVAEVAARFTLDAMPGKQMAIDADLNSGLIDEQEAKERRQKIQREADFYGAMDGATKFVKGDAIASIVITIVNFVGGLIVGMVSGGMAFGEVLSVYTLATVGDGLVSQIPALLIATATGMIVTRASSNDNLISNVARQMSGQPIALFIAAGAVATVGIIPGAPKFQIFTIAAVLAALAFILNRTRTQAALAEGLDQADEDDLLPEMLNEASYYKNIDNVYGLLGVDPITMEFGYSLIPHVDESSGGSFIDRIIMFRKQFATDYGVVVPTVQMLDNGMLNPNQYAIKIKGEEVARGEVLVDYYLAMDPGTAIEEIEGIDTVEPAYGIPSKWITEDLRETAEVYGYTVIDPLSVIITHMSEIVKRYIHEVLTRQDITTLLENTAKQNPAIVADVVPGIIGISDLQKVLCNLLKEGVPIKDMETILETLGDYGLTTKDPDLLTEYVRQRLKRTITRQYVSGNVLKVITVDQDIEQAVMGSIKKGEHGTYMAMEPDMIQKIVGSLIEDMNAIKDIVPVPIVLTSPIVRIYLKKMLDQFNPNIIVLSFSEIDPTIQIQSLANVQI